MRSQHLFLPATSRILSDRDAWLAGEITMFPVVRVSQRIDPWASTLDDLLGMDVHAGFPPAPLVARRTRLSERGFALELWAPVLVEWRALASTVMRGAITVWSRHLEPAAMPVAWHDFGGIHLEPRGKLVVDFTRRPFAEVGA